MTWGVGTCQRCGEPRGPYVATLFKVRVLFTWLWYKRRVWEWWCDECTVAREERRRHRLRQRDLRRWLQRGPVLTVGLPIPELPEEFLDWPGKAEGKPKPPIIWCGDKP